MRDCSINFGSCKKKESVVVQTRVSVSTALCRGNYRRAIISAVAVSTACARAVT